MKKTKFKIGDVFTNSKSLIVITGVLSYSSLSNEYVYGCSQWKSISDCISYKIGFFESYLDNIKRIDV